MLLLTVDQKVVLTIRPVDRGGNPAPLDGVPVWSTTDTDLLTLTPAADGLSCAVITTGKLGAGQVNVVGDARIGDEVKNISGALDVNVQAGEAVNLTIEAGAPTLKDEVVPA